MKIYLATGITQNYIPSMVPFLKTIEKCSNFDKNILMCVGFTSELNNNSKNILDLHLKFEDIKITKFICLQNGEFLNHEFFSSVDDNDIICFTDGDLLMQRSLSDSEISLIKNLGDTDVLMQVNGYEGEPLLEEYKKLNPRISYNDLCKKIGGVPKEYAVYNTGVIIAKKKSWKVIREKYLELLSIIDDAFEHNARMQWLVSFVVNKYLTPKLMSPTIHTHFHGGPTRNSHFKDDVLYIEDQICVFPHFCYIIPDNPKRPFLNKFDYLDFQQRYVKKHITNEK